MHLIQFTDDQRRRYLGVVSGDQVTNLTAHRSELCSTVAAFQIARRSGRRLQELLEEALRSSPIPKLSYAELFPANHVLPPVTEEPRSRLLISGTGLTHLGSVQQRDEMHRLAQEQGPKSDTRKMFELGLAGGRPVSEQRGTAPEWFYKGDGRSLRGPGEALDIPPFAPDGGEEPEIVGIYVIDDQGVPCRLGFAQGNEWSDHVTENINYLYLAPSKLRVCAIGPELVLGLDFQALTGRCRVLREDEVIYDSGELLTGTEHMCHSLTNIEDHHFKFPQHRQPGDVHVHFFGTSKLSFQHRKWRYETGDVVEVSFPALGAPLRNPVRRIAQDNGPIPVVEA